MQGFVHLKDVFNKLNGCFRLNAWKKIGYFIFHILPFSFVLGVEGVIGRQNKTGHCCEDQEVLKQVCSPLSTFSMTDPFPRVVKAMTEKPRRNYCGSPEATFQWHSLDLYGTGRESKYVLIGMSLNEKYRCLLHFSWWDIREKTWRKSRKEHRREMLMRRKNSV